MRGVSEMTFALIMVLVSLAVTLPFLLLSVAPEQRFFAATSMMILSRPEPPPATESFVQTSVAPHFRDENASPIVRKRLNVTSNDTPIRPHL